MVRSVLAAIILFGAGSVGLIVPGPAPARAAEYSMSTAATYEVVPDDKEVHVTVKVKFRNTTPNPPRRFSVFEVIDLAVHDGARQVRVADDRGRLSAQLDRRGGVNVVSVRPRQAVRYREITRFTLRYTLSDGAADDVRIRPSVVIFPAWSFGTVGSVRVGVPGAYEVLVDGNELTSVRAGESWRLDSGEIDDPTRWLSLITATLPSSYVTFSRAVPMAAGTVDLQVRAWSDDRAWGRRTRQLLAAALPLLEAEIGLQLEPAGPLVVVESLPGSGGELTEPTPSGTDIAVGFDEPPFTLLHQLAHAWLTPALAEDRWMREGFASHAAAVVAAELEVARPYAPAREADDLRAAAFPLVSWGAGETSAAQDRYAYAASWAVADELGRAVGEDVMRRAWQRIAAGVDAYQPVEDQPPAGGGLPAAPADSRHLLDQIEAVGGGGAVSIFEQRVFDEGTVALLPAREQARAAHRDLLQRAGSWGSPDPVRLALAGWRFADAEAAMAEALDWLADRDDLLNDIEGAGLMPPERLREEYQRGGGSRAARNELDAEAAVVATYAEAASLSSTDRSIVQEVGLLGSADPTAALAEAHALFGEGDLVGAAELATDTLTRLQQAGQDGLVRLASAVAVLLALAVLAVTVARRRGRADPARYTAAP